VSWVAALAAKLPTGLIHPGDQSKGQPAHAIPLPGLSNTGMPAAMAKQFAEDAGLPDTNPAQLLTEAIAHTITTLGYTVIPDSELEELHAKAAEAPDGTRIITVHTDCDRLRSKPILELAVTPTSDKAVIPCLAFKALTARNPDCPH